MAAIRKLLGNGADINGKEKGMLGQTPLVACEAVDGTNVFYLLLELGADVNAPAKDGITPLMEALVLGDANSVKVKELIRRGANVNARDSAGNSVLAHARASGCRSLLPDLLEAGAKESF